MSIKSDLASEIIKGISKKDLPTEEYHRFEGVDITKIKISSGAQEKAAGRPAGIYTSIEAESILDPSVNSDCEIKAIAAEVLSMLPKSGTVLVVGIGNESLVADSLGAKAVAAITAGSFLKRRLCCLSTGVCGKTGFSPLEMIKSVIKTVNPVAIILIDALAAENIEHIGRTVQITDAGICPGSGVGKEKFELSRKVFNVPTVCIGLPSVISYPIKANGKTVFVSPCDIDITIKRGARLIALATELAVFPALGLETIKELSY